MASAPVSSGHAKKRSHHETEADDEPMPKSFVPAPTPRISPDEVHGSNIPMKDPMTGCEKAVASQPGVSVQEKLVDEYRAVVEQKVEAALRPTVERQDSAPKRQRQDSSDSSESQSGLSNRAHLPALTAELASSPDFAQLMGVGWSAIDSDPDTVSAWRGIGKGIAKTVNISDVTVVAKNVGLNACVAHSQNGWYLVSTTAHSSRFLGQEGNEALRALRENPDWMKEIAEAQSGVRPANDAAPPSPVVPAPEPSLSAGQSASASEVVDKMDVD